LLGRVSTGIGSASGAETKKAQLAWYILATFLVGSIDICSPSMEYGVCCVRNTEIFYTVNFNNQSNLIRSSSVNLVVVLTMDEQVKSTKGTVKLSGLADFKFTHGGV